MIFKGVGEFFNDASSPGTWCFSYENVSGRVIFQDIDFLIFDQLVSDVNMIRGNQCKFSVFFSSVFHPSWLWFYNIIHNLYSSSKKAGNRKSFQKDLMMSNWYFEFTCLHRKDKVRLLIKIFLGQNIRQKIY